jgi:hypothetical protein
MESSERMEVKLCPGLLLVPTESAVLGNGHDSCRE